METKNMRRMKEEDRAAVAEMMKRFYESPAVHSNGSMEIFNSNISECLSGRPFAEGFVFTREDGSICGYAMLVHAYTTEYGMPAIWIEDIYLEEDMRGKGLADDFFDHVKSEHPDHLHRLEAESDNYRAIRSYEKNGFTKMPYLEMMRLPDDK